MANLHSCLPSLEKALIPWPSEMYLFIAVCIVRPPFSHIWKWSSERHVKSSHTICTALRQTAASRLFTCPERSSYAMRAPSVVFSCCSAWTSKTFSGKTAGRNRLYPLCSRLWVVLNLSGWLGALGEQRVQKNSGEAG